MKKIFLISMISLFYAVTVFSQSEIVQFHTRIEHVMKDQITESGNITVKFLLKLTEVSNTQMIYISMVTDPEKENIIDMIELYIDKDKEGYFAYNKEIKSIRINGRMLVVEKEYDLKKISEAGHWASTYLIDFSGNKSKKQYYKNYFPN